MTAALEAGRRDGVAPALGAAVRRGGAVVHHGCHGEVPAPEREAGAPRRPLRRGLAHQGDGHHHAGGALWWSEGTLRLDAPAGSLASRLRGGGQGRVTRPPPAGPLERPALVAPVVRAGRGDPAEPDLRARRRAAAIAALFARSGAVEAPSAEPLERRPGPGRSMATRASALECRRPGERAARPALRGAGGGAARARATPSSSDAPRPGGHGGARAGPGLRADRARAGRARLTAGDGERRQRLGAGRRRRPRRALLHRARRGGLGQAWLDALDGRPSAVPARGGAPVRRAATRAPGRERALGWDTPSPDGSTLGDVAGAGAAWRDRPPGLHRLLALARPRRRRWWRCCSRTTSTRRAAAGPRSWPCGRRFHDAVAEAAGVSGMPQARREWR